MFIRIVNRKMFLSVLLFFSSKTFKAKTRINTYHMNEIVCRGTERLKEPSWNFDNDEGANFVSTLSRNLRPKHVVPIRSSSFLSGNCDESIDTPS